MKNTNRIKQTDKYDGTDVAKQRLLNLFLFTHMNIKEYCRAMETYRTYYVKTINAIENDRKIDYLPYYSDITNRVLKITEIDNVLSLNRLLFNVLSAFDAFIGYISKELKHISYNELKELVDTITPLLNAKTIDTNQDFDLMELLHQARNALIHSGDFVCKFMNIPSGEKDMVVPALAIIPSQIFSEQYCKQHNIINEYCVDTYEVFKKISEALSKLDLKFLVD